MIDLNSPIFSQELRRIIEQQVDRRLAETQPRRSYGTVTAVDTANLKATVALYGEVTGTPGFSYEPSMPPVVGDHVRVVSFGGDRYIEANLTVVRRGWRYVSDPDRPYSPFNAATTTVEVNSTAQVTGIPTDGSVRAVSGIIVVESTINSQNASLRLRNWDTTTADLSMGGSVYGSSGRQAGHFFVTVGGVNGREFRYNVKVPSGATVTYWVMVAGYWIEA